MGGVNGDSSPAAASQPSPTTTTVASPILPASATPAASPLLTRAAPFHCVSDSVTTAVVSLQGLLLNLSHLETQFRACGDALTASASLTSTNEGTAPTPVSPGGGSTGASAPQLLATLDTLAAATTRSDADVGQQLASLRRGVAVLSHELHSLAERYPTLQSGVQTSPSLARTPHVTPSTTTPNSVRAGSQPLRPLASGGNNAHLSPSLTSAAAPLQQQQQPAVVTPATSPQLQAGSFANRSLHNTTAHSSSVGGGRGGDVARSPASLGSSVSSPARTAARAGAAAVTPTSQPMRAAASPGRSSGTLPLPSSAAASPASPPSLACLLDRVADMRLPTSQLPHTACTASVKAYLAHCVEWPPLPRRRHVRPLTPHQRRPRASSHCGVAAGRLRHADSEAEGEERCDNDDDDEDAGFHTPATSALRRDHDGRADAGAASAHRPPHRRRSDADDFLRRLTEESPYDMSMLRTPGHTSGSTGNSKTTHSSSSNSSGSRDRRHMGKGRVTAGEEDEEALDWGQRLSASGSRQQVVGAVGNGKRRRSRDDRHRSSARRSSGAASAAAAAAAAAAAEEEKEEDVRRGRPTIVESVDALVLAQLKADGIALTGAMEQELRGCDVADEEAATTAAEGNYNIDKSAARRSANEEEEEEVGCENNTTSIGAARTPFPASTVFFRNDGSDGKAASLACEVFGGMRPMAKAPHLHKSRKESALAAKDDVVDFAGVLHEVREFVRGNRNLNGGTGADGSAVFPVADASLSSKTFPSVPATWKPKAHDSQKNDTLPQSTSPAQLPTTTAWLDQIKDFCALLDEMATHPTDADHSNSTSSTTTSRSSSEDAEEEGSGGGNGGRARRTSHTTTTTATRERVSPRGGARRSRRGSSASSSAAPSSLARSSDTVTAASENDFSIADDLFTSAEEAEEDDGHPPPHQAAASDAASGRAVSHTAQPATAHSSLADPLTWEHSRSGGSGAPSQTVVRVSGARVGAEALDFARNEEGEDDGDGPRSGATRSTTAAAPLPTPLSRDLTHITAFEDFWLERGDVPVSGGSPSSEALLRQQTSSGAGMADSRASAPANPLTRLSRLATTETNPTSGSGGGSLRSSPAAGAAAEVTTPGARVLAQRNQRHERQRRRTLRQTREHFLRQRYPHLHLLREESVEEGLTRRGNARGPAADGHEGNAEGSSSNGGSGVRHLEGRRGNPLNGRRTNAGTSYEATPLMNYRAAARELRALSATLQTDLTLLATLQELSRGLTGAAAPAIPSAPASLSSEGRGGGDDATVSASSTLTAALQVATQLLLSVQERRSIQARIQQELQLRGLSRGDYENTSVAALSTANGAGYTAAASTSTTTALLLSTQHPLSALGYAPLLERVVSAFAKSDGRDEEGQSPGREEQVIRYLVAATPYLLAWQPSHTTAQKGEEDDEEGSQAAASAHGAVALPAALPFPVWVYVEAVTTELLEAARKLNACYQLFVLLVTEATVAGGSSSTSSGNYNSTHSIAVHGGMAELLALHVRRNGRATAVRRHYGVAGLLPSLNNGLEKFVAPVSTHLLQSFDQLESRHLMQNVFHEVHLSDVMARRRALKKMQQERRQRQAELSPALSQQQQQQPSSQLVTSPPSSSSASRPPPHPAVAQRRSRGSTGAGDDEGALDSFALPPGTLSSSPALRSAAGVQWSMRDAEQQQQQQQSGRSTETPVRESGGDGDGEDEDEYNITSDDVPSHAPARRTAATSRDTNRSGSSGSEPRHVTIEGFVRFLTGGAERLRAASRGSDHNDNVDDDTAQNDNADSNHGGSPSSKPSPHRASNQPQHHSGLTLDVPHTSALLKDVDGRYERATSNAAVMRVVESDLQAQALVEDVLGVEGGQRASAGLRAVGVSKRHFFSSRAAAFTAPLTTAAVGGSAGNGGGRLLSVSVVQCRWQPVFQSTMCFCPVTRRRCLDPLVCGALLICSPLPPHEIFHSSPEALTSPAHNGRHASPGPGASSPLPFPATIRALRSGLERAIAVRTGGGGDRPTPGPSARRSDASREPTASPSSPGQAAVIATLRSTPPQPGSPPPQPSSTSTSPSVARAAAAAAAAPVRAAPTATFASPVSSLFPGFFLRRTMGLPERMAIPRILTQIPTALYADSSAVAGVDDGDNSADEVTPEEALPAAAQRALRVVTVPLEVPPITRNLLMSPDATQARWLNPPTLLECGHVVSHKTYMDLRTSARRLSRAAAASNAAILTVVCCPYCSKITPAKDALTLSYLY